MAAQYVAASAGFAQNLGLLIIDEAKDFDAGWLKSLCSRLKPDGRRYVLEDEAQRLYRQDGFELGLIRSMGYREPHRTRNRTTGAAGRTVRRAARNFVQCARAGSRLAVRACDLISANARRP